MKFLLIIDSDINNSEKFEKNIKIKTFDRKFHVFSISFLLIL